ncbi:MAG: hypothetical protein JKY57_04805 [Kordiimonadaceae bacterium]|nr:hypothetical protein [Kordiimonadaceae bacterium]
MNTVAEIKENGFSLVAVAGEEDIHKLFSLCGDLEFIGSQDGAIKAANDIVNGDGPPW